MPWCFCPLSTYLLNDKARSSEGGLFFKYSAGMEKVNLGELIVKERIEDDANEKAALRFFSNCPFVCINFDFSRL